MIVFGTSCDQSEVAAEGIEHRLDRRGHVGVEVLRQMRPDRLGDCLSRDRNERTFSQDGTRGEREDDRRGVEVQAHTNPAGRRRARESSPSPVRQGTRPSRRASPYRA